MCGKGVNEKKKKKKVNCFKRRKNGDSSKIIKSGVIETLPIK